MLQLIPVNFCHIFYSFKHPEKAYTKLEEKGDPRPKSPPQVSNTALWGAWKGPESFLSVTTGVGGVAASTG